MVESNNASANRNANNGGRLAADTYVFQFLVQLLHTSSYAKRVLKTIKAERCIHADKKAKNKWCARWLVVCSNTSERHRALKLMYRGYFGIMKRYGNLFDKICDIENIRKAFNRAAKGKKWRRTVRKALSRIDVLAPKLRDLLLSGEYHTSQYRTRIIHEPKERTIYILPFYPDRVAHHAVMAIIEPLLDKLMYFHSYACRPKKGQIKGSNECMKHAMKYEYCLKCDVSKFYPSVNHEILKNLLRKKFKDARLLALLDEIIDSAEGETNVPIGNYLSQWFGNYYLNELDTFVKQELHCKPYIRYCDDFVLFSDDKHQLRDWAEQIKNFCATQLKLKLSKCNIFKTNQGVDFLGYRHFHNGRIILRKRTALRVRRRMRGILAMLNAHSNRLNVKHALGQTASAIGLLKHCKSKGLRTKIELKHIFTELRDEAV